MTTASQPSPSAQSPTPTAPNVSAAAVSSALQALKDVSITQSNSSGQVNTQDPNVLNALLSLFGGQNQKKPADQVKEAAAETLSNLSQSAGPPSHQSTIHPQLQESGPSSHPHGPPSLGMPPPAPPSDQADEAAASPSEPGKAITRRQRSGPPAVNGFIMATDEWNRMRKDNHKEVERRRRGNINEGINELARIVPNGTGEKAKGAILSRAVQYIHHLKENEARNIEKWTLEKLLMDQAMGDLQAQLEDVRRMWQEEVHKREKAEADVVTVKAELALATGSKRRSVADTDTEAAVGKNTEGDGVERGAKRPRVDA